MIFHVVDLAAPANAPVAVPRAESHDGPWGNVLYAPVPLAMAIDDVDPALVAVDSKWRRLSDVVVLRLHSSVWLRMRAAARAAEVITRRFEGKPVVAVTWIDGRHVAMSLAGAEFDVPSGFIDSCQHAEMAALLTRDGVVLPRDPTLHYQGPNGRHYDEFIRVGTAVQAVDGIDGIAFWLLQHLHGGELIVLDSWTILSIGLNLDRYLAAEGLSHFRPVDVECVRSYGEEREILAHRIRSASDRHREVPRILSLVSVSSSGAMAERISAAAADAGIADCTTVTIFGDAERVAGPVLCAVPEVSAYSSAATCTRCKDGVAVARIQPGTYLLEVSANVERTRIALAQADSASQFFSRYSGLGVVSVHRDQDDGARHHAIDVDVQRLSEVPAFDQRLDELLGQAMRPDEAGRVPDVILIPAHASAVDLGHKVASKAGLPIVICDEFMLGRASPATQEQLGASSRILIVDDVVLTGTRLQGYRYHLRAAGYLGTGGKAIDLLVGLARPTSLDALAGIVDTVHGERHFHAVEQLVLPNWGVEECPWCRERAMLEAARGMVDGSPLLSRRYGELGDTRAGLREDLFLPWSGATGEVVPTFTLGPDSIFTAANEVELFVGIASALQILRSSGALAETFAPPIARVLDPHRWLGGRYYDPVIKACILRAAKRHDLRTPQLDREAASLVSGLIQTGTWRGLYGEIAFAMAHEHLPLVNEMVDPAGVLDEVGGDLGLRNVLKAAILDL